MADQKVTKMVMKVDLKCDKCFRKIKKVLCSCLQIRDQVFDEKQNTVTITVICCSPEKIMEKIARKAGDTVESIEILPDQPKEKEKKESEKPKPVEKSKEPEKPKKPEEQSKSAEKPKEPEKKEPEKTKPAESVKPKPAESVKPKSAESEKPKELPKPDKPKVVLVEPPKEAAKPPAQAPAPKAPVPAAAPALPPTLPEPIVQGFPQLTPIRPDPMYPFAMCCCHEGGPCYHGYGQPPTWYNGYVHPAYEFPDRNRGYYVNRCDYFSEENASGCSIM